MLKKLLLPILLLAFMALEAKETGSITVEIQNVESTEGNFRVALYNSAENFKDPESKPWKSIVIKANSKQRSVTFENIPYGTYSSGLYQDKNLNKKLDKNFIGIPKEPYGLSNNVRPKLSAPPFDRVKFKFNSKKKTVHIKLIQ